MYSDIQVSQLLELIDKAGALNTDKEDFKTAFKYLLNSGLELSVLTQTSTATLTPSPSYDYFEITAQAEALTIANPSTAYGNFEIFTVTVTDDGNAQDIVFGDKFRPFGTALPTETTAGKTMDIVCRYNATADKYDVKWSEEV